MATKACDSLYTKPYLGAWNAWTNDFNSGDSDGYSYGSSNGTQYAFCFKFKTPSIDNFLKSSKLNITFPIIRTSSGFATSGTLYFKLFTSDPTDDKGKTALDKDKLNPTSSDHDASCQWESNDQAAHKVTFSIGDASLKPSTTYYVTVGSSKLIGIGYKGKLPEDGWWDIELEYSTYVDGTAPTLTMKDAGDNRVLVSGNLGKEGSNNDISSATLFYTTDGSDPADKDSARTSLSLTASTGASYSKYISITQACTVKAYVACKFEHNNTSATGSLKAKYYADPSSPGEIAVSYSKSRFTIKEPWKISWAIATAGNADSPIKGYRFRIYKKAAGASKFTTIPVYDTSGKLLSADMGTDSNVIDHRYYYDVAAVSMTIDPTKHNVAPGDTIKIGLYAYTKNGVGTQLFNDTQKFSKELLIQNAGIMHVNVNNVWKESQVYVKVNGAWQEAESVSTKVNNTWYESE